MIETGCLKCILFTWIGLLRQYVQRGLNACNLQNIWNLWGKYMNNIFNRMIGRNWLVLPLFMCLLGSGLAEAATYAYRNDVFAYDTPSGSASTVVWHTTSPSPACTGFPNGDDDWADVNFPSGFTFTFAGTAYSSIRIYSNGILAFPPDTSGFHRDYTPQALPAPAGVTYTGCPTSAPVNIMLPYWIDIVAGTANSTTGASIQYELLGTAPNRRFVISWVNVKLYGQTARYNFQVALYEGASGINGNFKYQYTTGSSTGTSSTVGVQLSSTDYTQYSYNQAFIDTVNGTSILWYPANQLQTKMAEYRFDESSWNGTAGEVIDTSGNSKNASRVGAAINIANGKLCRGGSFTSNTSNNTIDAVATPIVPGNQGAVDFWYKSTNSWATSDTMLFDATTVANRPFFMMKRSNGALRFVLSDSAGTVITAESPAQSFAAGTWVHVGVSWNVLVGTNQTTLQIFINGVLQNGAPTRVTTTGFMPALSSIYVGDNRTAGVTPTNGTPNGANGTIDEVYVYPIEISAPQVAADMNLTRATCTTLDHFHIVHGGAVVNCNSAMANVTIEAHDVNHALFSLAGSTMTVSNSLNHGTWSVVSAISPVVNISPGTATYTFSNESSVILGLTNPNIEALNINVSSGAVTEGTGAAASCVSQDYTFGSVCDANLNFADSGFLFDVLNHVAEVSQSVTVSAVKKADNSLACTPAFASVSKSLTFSCAYANPVTGTLPVRVGSTALNSTGSASAACDAGGKAVSLNFNASGVATTTVQYADVGKMTLNATHTTAGGVVMTGTDSFIAAPASFAFSAITAGPIAAGTNFSASVTARNAASTPAATPNFGKESTPESVNITFAKCHPTGTNSVNGLLSGGLGAFTNGLASASNLTWSEVGNIDLIATLASGNYLSSGLSATGNTGSTGATCSGGGGAGLVGRFMPHHFDTVVTQGCNVGGFTYSAQPFLVTVTAKNGLASPTTTANYDGTANTSPNFAKAVTLSDGNASTTGALSNTAVSSALFIQGVATTANPPTTASSPLYAFTSRQTAPTVIKLRATDTDSVSSATGSEGTTTVRSGRANLSNAHGSELLDLPVPFRVEYWNGSWLKNTVDSCTTGVTLTLTDVITTDGLVPGGTCVLDSGNPGLSGIGCAVAGVPPKRFAVPPVAADFLLWLKAPGVGKSGALNLTATVPAWLQFNWKGVGDVNPSSRVTFGVNAAKKSPIIYMRENY